MPGYFYHPTSGEDVQKLPAMISQDSGVENSSNPGPYTQQPRIPPYQYVSVKYPQRPRMSKTERAQLHRRRSRSPSPDPPPVQTHYRSRTPLIQQPDTASTTTVYSPGRLEREKIVIDLTTPEPEPEAASENRVYDQVTSVRVGSQQTVVIHQASVPQPAIQGKHQIGLEVPDPASWTEKRVMCQASDLQRDRVFHSSPERYRQSEVETYRITQAIPQSLPQVTSQFVLQPVSRIRPEPVTGIISQYLSPLTPQPARPTILQKIHPLPPKPDASTVSSTTPALSSNPLIPTEAVLPPRPPVSAAGVQTSGDFQRVRSQNLETCIFIDLTEDDSDDEAIRPRSNESTTGRVRDARYSAATQFTGRTVVESRFRARVFAEHMMMRPPIDGHTHCHTLWTDGSLVGGRRAGGAVVWRNHPEDDWKSLKRRINFETSDSNLPEVMAVSMAMDKAVDLVRTARSTRNTALLDEVFIFTDSTFTVRVVRSAWIGSRGARRGWYFIRPWVDQLLESYAELRAMGVRVELHWVPGHSGVEGNSMAHNAARESTRLSFGL
ncbi:uncharacterized protein N7483_002826 [Penicillium malachiteum]|uniref:uncharacterized protein n=1 Tax=Penicillium malachiteum TaxID=1324776 RepID=UPI002549BA62|nr:uncharacterized protein N7483_002826 [Penicillium malachiteum]KAJ5737701.1 hypothetical protein N7483_002826 [Penicillium malachiteum]